MRRQLLALTLSAFIGSVNAEIVGGKTYRIASAYNTNRVLFVTNSATKSGTSIVAWTDTKSPAQQWRAVKNADGTFCFVNVQTQGYLSRNTSAISSSTSTVQMTAATEYSNWTITPVSGTTNGYTMKQTASSKDYVLTTNAAKDGETPTYSYVTDKSTIAKTQTWIFTEEEPIETFSTALGEEMIDDWIAYHLKDRGDDLATLGNGGGWGDAEMLETLLDAYETTGNKTYLETFEKVFGYFFKYIGSDFCKLKYDDDYKWYGHDFNDDVMWMILATVRAYLLTGTTSYRTYAKNNFDAIYSRALNQWGMMRWAEQSGGKNGTNSCINAPTVVAACYLAEALSNSSDKAEYYEKARNLYEKMRRYMFNTHTGAAYDSFTWSTDTNLPSGYNKWVSTYNQGTTLGAAILLYNHYGDERYRQDADRIVEKTLNSLCNSDGIVNTCQTVDGDLCGFKGILMRYMRRYAVDLNHPEIAQWLGKNALLAYSNRNSTGITQSSWLTKSNEDFVSTTEKDDNGNYKSFSGQAFGNSTAVSAAANAIIYDRPSMSKDAFSTIEAEHFDYFQGTDVVACTDGSGNEINTKPAQYTIYNNVNFGSRVARSVQFRVGNIKDDTPKIEIRLDNKAGTLLGTASFAKQDGYQTITADIVPTDGMHNICLLFGAGKNWSKRFTVDNFVFLTDSKPLPNDITDGNGTLYSTEEGLQTSLLTDNRATTSVGVEAKTATFTFHSDIPTKLKGYAIANGNGDSKCDPKAWTVLASNDQTTWTTLDSRTNQSFDLRSSTKNYNINAAQEYSYFRLNITENNGGSSLYVGEWQLFGEAISASDITADGGSLSPNTSTVADKKANTHDKIAANESQEYIYNSRGQYRPTCYSITSASQGGLPEAWTLYGKDDDEWVVVDKQSNVAFHKQGCTQFYKVETDAAYQDFKLVVEGGTSGVSIAEWQLFGLVTTTTTLFSDITDNVGELSSTPSADETELKKLFDNDVNTTCTLPFSGTTEIVYHSEIPVNVSASRLFAGNDDSLCPKKWSIEASNDGKSWTSLCTSSSHTFSKKGDYKVNKISNNSTWTYIRLTISEVVSSSAKQVVLGEWQIHGTAIATQDLTDSNGTATAEMAGMNDKESLPSIFDRSSSTKYCFNYYGTAWMQYEFNEAKTVNLYSITSANDANGRDPYMWELQASNDETNWTTIDSRSNQTFYDRYTTQFYTAANASPYKYYRLQWLENNGEMIGQISEWQMFYSEKQATGIGDGGRLAEEARVYLSATKDILNINMPTAGTVNVYNSSGMAVQRLEMKAGNGQINISSLPTGLYILKVVTGTNSTSLKFVK